MLLDNFKFGRKTNLNCKEAAGTLPSGSAGCHGPKSVEHVFIYNVFGKQSIEQAWKYTTALMAVHSVGGLSYENSGIDGSWSSIIEQEKFDNKYF